MGIQDNSIEMKPSQKMLDKAKSLSVAKITPSKWYVVGGSEPHVVEKILNEWECDCLAFRWNNTCSHILAVEIFCAKEDENVE